VRGARRIGREVAKRGGTLGANLIYNDKVKLSEKNEGKTGIPFHPLDNFLMESHVVSLHVPLTDETKGGIGERQLRKMRPNAILINTSREELVNEADLGKR